MKNIEKQTIAPSTTLLNALKLMDERKVKTLFVFKDERFVGILTVGDVQRAIIKNVSLTDAISRILDKVLWLCRRG